MAIVIFPHKRTHRIQTKFPQRTATASCRHKWTLFQHSNFNIIDLKWNSWGRKNAKIYLVFKCQIFWLDTSKYNFFFFFLWTHTVSRFKFFYFCFYYPWHYWLENLEKLIGSPRQSKAGLQLTILGTSRTAAAAASSSGWKNNPVLQSAFQTKLAGRQLHIVHHCGQSSDVSYNRDDTGPYT